MDRNAQGTEQSNQATPRFNLGVLFIHGIGAQKRGQTLAEFGGPLYLWLGDRFHGLDRQWRKAINGHSQQTLLGQWRRQIEDWATDGFQTEGRRPEGWVEPDSGLLTQLAEQVKGGDTVVGRVGLIDALVDDPEDRSAPAHAELRIQRQLIDGRSEVESWLLAESWWAETFIPPSFAEVARWGIHVIPWTIGSHFGTQVRRVVAVRPPEWSWKQTTPWLLGWLTRLPMPVFGLFAGLLATPFLLAALVVLLGVWLLPIPQVKEALLKLQRTIASTLGDSYIFVARPMEAASIVSQVRRDIAWLAARCNAVAIVAHSQGGAIAHIALKEGVPPKLKLLFTFGSGLKKLEQLKYVLSYGRSYITSAFFTLVALLFFSFSLLWIVAVLFLKFQSVQVNMSPYDLPIMVGFLLGSGIFLTAGLGDFVGDIDIATLKRWTQRLTNMPLDWVDCFATADPVSNGILIDERAIKELSKEVSNEASIVRDHTSYWSNRDQFVALLIERLTRPKLRREAGLPLAPELALDQSDLVWIGERRRWRVGILSMIGWIGIISVLLAVYENPEPWLNLLANLADRIVAWGVRLLGGAPKLTTGFTLSWSLVYVPLILMLYWIAQWLWRAWNEVEMRTLVEGGSPTVDSLVRVYLGISWQLLAAGLVVYGIGSTERVIMFVLILTIVLAIPSVLLAPWKPKHSEASPSSGEPQSHMGRVWMFMNRMFEPLILPFCLGLLGWLIFTKIVSYLGDSILGFTPSKISPAVVGLLVALFYAMFYTAYRVGGLVWIKRDRLLNRKRDVA